MKLLSIIFLISLLSCQPEESGESNAEIQANTTRWKSSAFPIDLKISNLFSNDEVNAFEEVTDEWQSATDQQIDFFTVDPSPSNTNVIYSNLNDYNDDEMGVYRMSSWNPSLPSSALAVTQLFGLQSQNGSVEITHADILLNDESYSFTTDEMDNSKYDLNTVMLHELGHFIGLSHINPSSGIESIMTPSISSSDVIREASARDDEVIQATYQIGDSLNAKANFEEIDQGPRTPVKILLELRSDGQCRHLQDGKLIHEHSLEL